MKKLILQPAERDVRMEETLYRLLTAFLAAGLLGAGVIWLFRLDLSPFLLPCALRTWLGIYCPGCGGSRSFRFLLHGQILQSLFYHPLVPYGAAVCGWYWITHTLRHLTRGRIKGCLLYTSGCIVQGSSSGLEPGVLGNPFCRQFAGGIPRAQWYVCLLYTSRCV